MSRPRITGKYVNYKGNPYEVLGFGMHTDSEEPFVIYQALYGDYRIWTRAESVFFGDVVKDGVTLPRLTYVGGARLRRLSQEKQMAARNFLLTQGRPLEQAKYLWLFEGGSVDEVYHALAAYQNPDGGFGHGLEPDLQTPDSSALATSVALQTLRHVDAPVDHSLVQDAMRWLVDNFDGGNDRWAFIPPVTDNAPHAPWWTVSDQHADSFGEYLINPRAELVGDLLHFRDAINDPPFDIDALALRTVEYVESKRGALNMHELLTVKALIGSRGLEETLRQRVVDAALASLAGVVATSAEELEAYSLHPTQLAQDPHSVFSASLAEAIQFDLDFLIDQQRADGAWHPAWSWGGLYDDFWLDAERQWSSVITLETLVVLHDWGRFSL